MEIHPQTMRRRRRKVTGSAANISLDELALLLGMPICKTVSITSKSHYFNNISIILA